MNEKQKYPRWHFKYQNRNSLFLWYTVRPRSSDTFYIVGYYINLVTTSLHTLIHTESFISYRIYILQITQPSQCRCTQLQYRFAVIFEAPSMTLLPYRPLYLSFAVQYTRKETLQKWEPKRQNGVPIYFLSPFCPTWMDKF